MEKEVIKEHSPLSEHVNHDRIKAILLESKTITKKLDKLQESQDGISQGIAKLLENQAKQDIYTTELWTRLTIAKNLLKESNVTGATLLLQELYDNHWASCPDELKVESLNLLAQAKELDGDRKEAIRLHGLAADISPQEYEKNMQMAYVYALRHDNEKMFELAKKIVNDKPNTPSGWALWIQSAPIDMDFVDIESLVPDIVL